MPSSLSRRLHVVAAGVFALVVVGAVLLWPDGSGGVDLAGLGFTNEFYDAEVQAVDVRECDGEPDPGTSVPLCATVVVELLEGPHVGDVESFEVYDLTLYPDLERGDVVVLSFDPDAGEEFRYQYADQQRSPLLIGLAATFAVTVVLLGRLRGLMALVGLVLSLAVLLVFLLPALVEGSSPVLVAVVGAALIAYLALYLAHGFGAMTTVALLGTLASLVLVVVLSAVVVGLADLTGLVSEEASFIRVGSSGLDFRGLVLAGIVIGALGAVDDMTVTQASAVWEIHGANPALGRRELYRSGLRIGRDHVASTVNTLVLAYAGASLPLLLLFVGSEQSLGTVANSEVVATEIIRTLVGSIGLVASVPLTTWLAAAVVAGRDRRRPTGSVPAASPQHGPEG